MGLRVLVLGSAAGGGFPQWNCGCSNCMGVRAGKAGLLPRTSDSLAVSANGADWWLLNASPEVLIQIQRRPELWPRSLRHSPIRGVVLTNGDLDHVLGLFQLRESQPLSVYATARVIDGLRLNVALRTLDRFAGQTQWHSLRLDEPTELLAVDGFRSGLTVLPFGVAGKPPLHLIPAFEPSAEDNVGLRVGAPASGALVYASAVASPPRALKELDDCAALFMDGTFWSELELPSLGVGTSPAKAMAHWPVGGEGGSLHGLERLQNVGQRFYTHVNNTNPMLDAASKERALLHDAGWDVASDGLELSL